MLENGTCIGYMKHNSSDTEKAKGQRSRLQGQMKLNSPSRKSWSLNTMLRAVFRPEGVLTLFLRTRTTGMVKSLGNVCR